MRKQVPLLLVFSIFLCGLRFIYLGDAPFIDDEPQFQLMIDQHLRNHTFPVTALVGLKGVAYGPTALWFYYPVRLFTSNISVLITYHALLLVTGLVLMTAAIWKSVGKETAAWFAALVTSSPYFFFYSRLAWDNTFFIFLTALACYCLCALEKKQSVVLWCLLGITSGLMFNLHLMSLAALGAIGFISIRLIAKDKNNGWNKPAAAFKTTAVAGLSFLLVVAPYLSHVWGSLSAGGSLKADITEFGKGFRYASRFLSWSGMDYFFDRSNDIIGLTFHSWIAKLYAFDPGVALGLLGWMGLVIVVFKLMTRKRDPIPLLARLGAVSVLVLVFYYAATQPDLRHPHYFIPIWWIFSFYVAWMTVRASGWRRIIATSIVTLTLLMNTGYIFAMTQQIHTNHGLRVNQYGPAHAELERVIHEICEKIQLEKPATRDRVLISVDHSQILGISQSAVIYIFHHDPACSSLDLGLSEDHVPSDLQFHLKYMSPESATDSTLNWH